MEALYLPISQEARNRCSDPWTQGIGDHRVGTSGRSQGGFGGMYGAQEQQTEIPTGFRGFPGSVGIDIALAPFIMAVLSSWAQASTLKTRQ